MTVTLEDIRSCIPTNYTIDDFLDQGGQGVVFKGSVDSSPAAIKLFNPDANSKRLSREIDLLREVECDHLVSIIDSCSISCSGQEIAIVAYEFLSGGDLCQMIGTSPDESLLTKIGHDIGTAIEVLWNHRIVHRDIKPNNLMRSVPQDSRFVLVDIGLARHLDRSDITAAGFAPGTRGFKSPEQALGRRTLTIKSDVHSLGVTLYLLASGQHPFDFNQHLIGTVTPKSLASHRPDLSPAFVSLIHEMMSVRAAKRPGNIWERFLEIMD